MTPWTIAHQAPLSMGFSRQESWSELPCPPPRDLPKLVIKLPSFLSPVLVGRFTTSSMWEVLVLCCAVLCLDAQSCLTVCNPMDCTLPRSSFHGDSLPSKNTGVCHHALLQGTFPPLPSTKKVMLLLLLLSRFSHV